MGKTLNARPEAGDYTSSMTSEQATNHAAHAVSRDFPQSIPLLLWSVSFAIAYGQSPLFTSNQNQYFLHGLAKSGYGQLNQDWLANTLDPTPVFSWLVWLVAETLPLATFYLVYGLLLATYFISLWLILDTIFNLRSNPFRTHGSALLLVAMHSAALRFGLSQFLEPDAAYLIEGGVAGQRLLGSVLQPSSFGVLLITSIAVFLRQRRTLAIALAVTAATFHPTYLLSAATLTASYLLIGYLEGIAFKETIKLAGLALLLVLPITLYTFSLFLPSSPGVWADAARILVTERIPHHALPGQWFSWTTILKLSVLLFALELSRRTRLALILLIPSAIALGLTVLQLVTGSYRLALLFPWRLSTWLVPLSSGLALFWSLRRLGERIYFDTPAQLGWRGPLIVILGLSLAGLGLFRTSELSQQQRAEAAQSLFQQVRQRLEPGQTYLVPPKLQDFRLESGAPAFVDFKAIPYQDRELLAWQERLRLAQFFYREDPAHINCDLLPRINSIESITHVVLEQDQFGLACPGLKSIYSDASFALFAYE